MKKYVLLLLALLGPIGASAQTQILPKVRINSTAADALCVGATGLSPASSACTGGIYAGPIVATGPLTVTSSTTATLGGDITLGSSGDGFGIIYNGQRRVSFSNAGSTTLSTASDVTVLLVTPTHATFTGNAIYANTTRAASSGFNLMALQAAGVQQFVVTGAGAVTSTGAGFFASTRLGSQILNLDSATNASDNTYINDAGYAHGYTQFRTLIIRNGKGTNLATFNGVDLSTTLAGLLTVPNQIVSNAATVVLVANASGTAVRYMQMANTSGNLVWGIDNLNGNGLFSGGAAYSSAIGTNNATTLHLATNATVRFGINPTGDWLKGTSIMDATGTPSCSANCTLAGIDSVFNATINAGFTTFVVTFGRTFTNPPSCTATPTGNIKVYHSAAPTTTTATFTLEANAGGTVVYIQCRGY